MLILRRLIMAKAYVEIRSQSPKGVGSWPRTGPDVYVAVQVVPDGVDKLTVLNKKVASKRGIDIIWCGEGYSNRCISSNSMLNIAITKAESLAKKINLENS